MDAEGLRELARVVCVVADHPHDHRRAGVDLASPRVFAHELLAEHLRRPSIETPLHDRPRRLERGNELLRSSGMILVVLPAGLREWIGKRRRLSPGLPEDTTEPV